MGVRMTTFRFVIFDFLASDLRVASYLKRQPLPSSLPRALQPFAVPGSSMFILLTSSLILGAAPACGPIDLDTALGLAAARSDEIAVKRADVDTARADESIAWATRVLPSATATAITGPSPQARGDVTSSPDSNRSWANVRPFGRFDVQVVQPLYTWGRLDAATQAAAAGVRARQDLVQDTTSQVQLKVAQLYWSVSLARRQLTIAADVQKALDDADKRITQALAEGDVDVAPADKYRLEVFRGIVAGRAADAQKSLELARLGIASSLGTSEPRLRLLEAPLDPSEGELPDARTVLDAAARQRPDLSALDAAIAARDAEVKAERGAGRPQIFITGAFSYSYAPNRAIQLNPWVSDPFNTFSLGAALGFRQDLSFPSLFARTDKAIAERSTLQRQRIGLARLVQVQVESALAELKAARARFAAAKSSFGSGRALFRSAGLDFAAGLIEAKALTDAYALYVESQLTAAQAAYDLVLARARLAQAAGELPRKGIECELP
jgi:outer membrane protein TolC